MTVDSGQLIVILQPAVALSQYLGFAEKAIGNRGKQGKRETGKEGIETTQRSETQFAPSLDLEPEGHYLLGLAEYKKPVYPYLL